MIDQGLKERLTGAVVLVLLGVIFIPSFLDGPDDPTAVRETRTLSLPGATRATTPDREPDKRPAQSGEAAAAGNSTSGSGASKPAIRVDEDKAAAQDSGAQQVAKVPLSAPANPLSAWAVQVGSFASQDNAERLSEALKKRGYRAFVTRLADNGKVFYRVRVGPEQERERAEQLARRLKKDGQEATLVSHP